MPASQMEMEKLKSDLMGDAQSAQERAQSAFATRGAPEESSFSPKAFRIAKSSFGEAELANADGAIQKLLGYLKTEAGFKDELEAGKFETDMKKKLNQFKMAAIRQAGMMERKLAEQGIEAAQREKIMRGISGLSEATAYAIGMGIGGGGGPTPVADSMKSPDLGSQFESTGPSLTSGMNLSTDLNT
jgi:hypothetical protein